jgi:hypothetical protein
MKYLFITIAVFFATAGYSQPIVDMRDQYAYAFTNVKEKQIDDKKQVERNGDTLKVIDKSIRFIVVDGVTYEIVRTTEVKKSEPVWITSSDTATYTWPNDPLKNMKGYSQVKPAWSTLPFLNNK